ncbi:MAG: carbamoyltransferase HypF [Anaerolineaceae bacterium]|nr:carbamoyltransferase HypF [Anaerolineaceae bacterium]
MIARKIAVKGIVQGVGFRPFVYTQAIQNKLTGWVRNTSAGVEIEIHGDDTGINGFIRALQNTPPPLSVVDHVQIDEIPFVKYPGFEIKSSKTEDGSFIPISPDMVTCADCQKELFSPDNRRFRYPFINCTNCGPRFTIIKDIPYDRPKTTMSTFPLCKECNEEYENPLDRRFHAQPVACQQCGPTLELLINGESIAAADDAVLTARKMLAEGKIVAIKGLGGYQIACDAMNQASLQTLRSRKHRSDKPFALMAFNTDIIQKYVQTNDAELHVLSSSQNPIVILNRLANFTFPDEVAPSQNTYGFMLPTSPLHLLLLEPAPEMPEVLVMTSGNMSDEPIAYQDEDAFQRLSKITDAILTHNRPIHTRTDDSVQRIFNEKPYLIRRSRGYAPNPIRLQDELPPILATGAELKNTFCLLKDKYAFLSHHIGDMENYETLLSFEQGIKHFENIFRAQPESIAADLHPDYMATRYAVARTSQESLPLIQIQHHHAHLASVMADNHLPLNHEPIFGLIFDGTGLGTDRTIWGGEMLLGNAAGYQRLFHLQEMPLPGGDAGIKKPSRIALAYLWQNQLEWLEDLPVVQSLCADDKTMLNSMLQNQINTPLTSSMGRLFDAVAALIGIRAEVTYEGQAAIELENCMDHADSGVYDIPLDGTQIVLKPLFEQIIGDIYNNIPVSKISARFHRGIAELCLSAAEKVHAQYGSKLIGLSGGVWQNMSLLNLTYSKLTSAGFSCLVHQQVPTNDGGLSLGQSMAAAAFIKGIR